MEQKSINGHLFAQMIYAGAEQLRKNSKKVDDLNVFPVPDGDTGTNMTLSIQSGVSELRKHESAHIGKAAQALSKGLLMGARGNSGVILSQLFRGFGKAVSDKEEIDAQGFVDALQQGVDAAYKAVMKPVEGTILTVAKEAAKSGIAKARKETNLIQIMQEVLQAAKDALAKTPQQLPILRQVGVVDAGGQGLVYVYEGFLAALRGDSETERTDAPAPQTASLDQLADMAHDHMPAQIGMRAEDIEYGYCTEFILGLKPQYTGKFDEPSFREHLSQFGDSLLVISDDELVKVHIHAEQPGAVLTYAQTFGDFKKIKIENMREQLQSILDEEVHGNAAKDTNQTSHESPQPIATLAVAAGDGLEEIFKSLGADQIIRGGQTMNPSTEEIVKAIEAVRAERVIILPNNGNIIMAAEQAKELVNVPVEVIPTKTIPQGMAALISFDPSSDIDTNVKRMNAAIHQVKTGQVTHAVRDSKFGDLEIKEGDYLGINEKEIVVSEPDLIQVSKKLLDVMLDEEAAVLTIIYGEEVTESIAEEIKEYAESQYPDLEVEVHRGGQPVYAFFFSVE